MIHLEYGKDGVESARLTSSFDVFWRNSDNLRLGGQVVAAILQDNGAGSMTGELARRAFDEHEPPFSPEQLDKLSLGVTDVVFPGRSSVFVPHMEGAARV